MLSRIFCVASFWFLFFVAMVVALTYALGLKLSNILPFGVVADFADYPLRFQTLGLQISLAGLVLLIKQIWPALGIMVVIALVAPLLALLFIPHTGRKAALKRQVLRHLAHSC